MKHLLYFLILLLGVVSCARDDDNSSEDFVAGMVVVGLKPSADIGTSFDFINKFDHKVYKYNCPYLTSSLPADQLQYILDYINSKPYTINEEYMAATGFINTETNEINVFVTLYEINNKNYQKDWLDTMTLLKLQEIQTKTDDIGEGVIYFVVPEGREKYWVNQFKSYSIVEWVELIGRNNYEPF